jgi:hypothetical protein
MKTTKFILAALGGLAIIGPMIINIAARETFTKGEEKKPFTRQLKAGDYVWKPQASPAGPVVLIISLPEQKLFVYRNGVRIGQATISSGKEGHRTPTGVFTILEKNVKHESSIYKGASMPYQERLTWGGVAMHAGYLPGYPASHGCVRLPYDFAQKVYQVTSRGTTVVVTDGKGAQGMTANPGLLLSGTTGGTSQPMGAEGFAWNGEKAPSGPVSIIFSRADGVAYVYRNGVEIGRAKVSGVGRFRGSHAYAALTTVNPDGSREWQALGSADGSRDPDLKALKKNMVLAPQFLANVRKVVAPGTTLIITDQPVNRTTRSGPGFKILTTASR